MTVSKRFFHLSACVMILAMLLGGVQTTASAVPPVPKNVIVMIADGMSFNHSLAASYYRFGAGDMQVYHEFPFQFAESTYSTDGWGYDPAKTWSDPTYVMTHYADSAATGTAMATGVMTYDAAIGVDKDGKPVQNVLEAAKKIGKSTGVATTVAFSHATPATFVAHNIDRDDYVGIAYEMICQSKADVIMGAGHPFYDADGVLKTDPAKFSYKYLWQTTWDSLVAGTAAGSDMNCSGDNPWMLVQTRTEFQSLMTGATPKRVMGVAQVAANTQQGRSGNKFADPYVVARLTTTPTLTEMSLAAINILDENPKGFALMIEAGAIDSAAHSKQPGRMIEEQIDFDLAVEAVVNWVENNSNWGETLLIVTGDHETGYLLGPGESPAWQPLVNNGIGVLPGMKFYSGSHTNSLIKLYAKGDDGRWFSRMIEDVDPVRGPYVHDTSIGKLIFKILSYGN